MKVLITGGAGYIGSELTHSLAGREDVDEILLYDNLSRGNHNLFIGNRKLPPKVRFIQGEILDSRTLKKVVKEVDHVYHLAAKVTTPFADQNPHLFEQTNHWGTAELVYAVEEADLKGFTYLSSISVLGASEKEMDDNTTPHPRTFYGVSKMRGEQHVDRLARKLPVHTIRCGNVYGFSESMRFDAVINKFMFEAHHKGMIKVHGNGEQHRSFVHIEKVSQVLSRMIDHPIPPGRYHLVERVLSIKDLVDELLEIYPELETLFVDQHLSLREIKVKPSEKILKEFGAAERTFKEELEEFRDRFAFQPRAEVS